MVDMGMDNSNSNVFISFNAGDYEVAGQLASVLSGFGLDVFLDGHCLDGKHWTPDVFAQLRAAKAVLVILSANTQGAASVSQEVTNALLSGGGRPVIPVLLDDDVKKNGVWPLVADRQGIGMGGEAGFALAVGFAIGWVDGRRGGVNK